MTRDDRGLIKGLSGVFDLAETPVQLWQLLIVVGNNYTFYLKHFSEVALQG